LDAKIISEYLIGYPKKSKGYIYYCPNYNMRIFETGNVRFIENGEISKSTVPRDVEIEEVRVQVLLACVSSSKVIDPLVVVLNNNEEEQQNNEPMIHNKPIVEEPQEVSLRRSQREMWYTYMKQNQT